MAGLQCRCLTWSLIEPIDNGSGWPVAWFKTHSTSSSAACDTPSAADFLSCCSGAKFNFFAILSTILSTSNAEGASA